MLRIDQERLSAALVEVRKTPMEGWFSSLQNINQF